jgi:hypothetical protein
LCTATSYFNRSLEPNRRRSFRADLPGPELPHRLVILASGCVKRFASMRVRRCRSGPDPTGSGPRQVLVLHNLLHPHCSSALDPVSNSPRARASGKRALSGCANRASSSCSHAVPAGVTPNRPTPEGHDGAIARSAPPNVPSPGDPRDGGLRPLHKSRSAARRGTEAGCRRAKPDGPLG